MPSSWTQNHYHLVFSTRRREPLISAELEERLHPFLGGIARDLGCTALAINGTSDHVHLLLRYPSDLSHADLARHIKARSSKWMHATIPALGAFNWQEGYGGFTVSRSAVDQVRAYIAGQKEHHRRMSFQEEFMELLRRHGVEFTPSQVFQ
ncbi:MAG: IS200/IS605 family transposase [Phycisphaerales bacterium]|nr:IS200/IS605 family transposase [Phycisphaerales bacterium]